MDAVQGSLTDLSPNVILSVVSSVISNYWSRFDYRQGNLGLMSLGSGWTARIWNCLT